MPATNGVATFSGCQIVGPVAPTPHRHRRPRRPTPGPTQHCFQHHSRSPAKLFITQPPVAAANGAAWPTRRVTIEDSGGNPTTSTDTVTLAIDPHHGPSSPAPAAPQPATNGVAAFIGCQIVGPVGTYTLTATDDPAGLTPAPPSTAFTITLRSRRQVVHHRQPPGSGRQRGDLGHPAGRDHRGQRRQHRHQLHRYRHAGHRLRAVRGHPRPAMAASSPATNGVATFSGCQIVGPVGSYTLTATDDTPHPVPTQLRVHHHLRRARPAGLHHPTRRRRAEPPGPPSRS